MLIIILSYKRHRPFDPLLLLSYQLVIKYPIIGSCRAYRTVFIKNCSVPGISAVVTGKNDLTPTIVNFEMILFFTFYINYIMILYTILIWRENIRDKKLFIKGNFAA